MQKYKHLNYQQRYTIERMLKEGIKKKVIVSTIGVNESSFYRELNRNSNKRGYSAKYAQMVADERKEEGHYKTIFTDSMKRYIKSQMENFDSSPEQIVGRAKNENIKMVSHERIYQYIWKDKAEGGTLYKHLRNANKKYRKRYGSNDKRGMIKNKVSIDKRPNIVDERIRVGDFESDLVIGKNHKGALLTIVDRYSGLTIIKNVEGKNADRVTKETINALAPLKKQLHTITNDNGKEFAGHQKIAAKLNCKVFFAHPYSSWERGTNENTNGLIRQYFPKEKELNNIANEATLRAMHKLNNRPRKRLGFKTPLETFYQYIYKNSSTCT